jgi:hypothetical protein
MDPRLLARMISVGRAAIGVVAIADPTRMLEPWIGVDSSRGSARLLGRALGARDLVLAAGALRSSGDAEALRPWVAAGVLADTVDLSATVIADDIPLRGRAFVIALAGAAAAGGAIVLAQLDGQA